MEQFCILINKYIIVSIFLKKLCIIKQISFEKLGSFSFVIPPSRT